MSYKDFALDKDSPIDWEKGKEYYGVDEEAYFDMLKEFEPLTFDKEVGLVHQSFKMKDWKALRSHSHTLKGPSGYYKF